jgi:hypothetical protein
MASHQTADDLTAGEWNWANDITLIVAANYDQGHRSDWRDYGGNQILIVTPDAAPRQRPKQKVDGVQSCGYLGGSGLVGFGCPIVDGKGAGTGGFGVVGNGGSGDLNLNAANQAGVGIHSTFDPGAGVVGIGGIWTGAQFAERDGARPERDDKGGAGVVGVAGGEHVTPGWPSFDQTRGVGVYGVSAVGPGVVADGVTNLTGNTLAPAPLNLPGAPPEVSQAGLWARGVQGVEARGLRTGVEATGGAVGVKGTSTGDVKQSPGSSGSDFYGVWGTGTIGVKGEGSIGISAEGRSIGINALGKSGPAGVFERQKEELISQPQIHIEPLPMWVPDPQDVETVSVLPDDDLGAQLPEMGNAGDLLMTIQGPRKDKPDVPDRPEATLWLCVVSTGTVKPAIWKQVLLGPPIEGMNVGKG